jgi:CBS domain-containing protein
MKVSEIMHRKATWVAPTTSLVDIAKMMRDEDIGAVPVGENDRLVGMVTDRDITCRGLTNGPKINELKAKDVMTKGIFYCRDDEEIDDAARIMERERVRRLPVINEKKRMVGMLSLGDISARANAALSAEVMKAVSAHHP